MKLQSKLLFLVLIIMAGCSSMDRKDNDLYDQFLASATFPMDYTGKPAKLQPETWAEFYDAGTFLYDTGKYDRATEYFLDAADLTTGEARRTCLAAALICALASGDTHQFVSIRQQLRDITEKDPFKQPTVTDKALEVMDKIDRF